MQVSYECRDGQVCPMLKNVGMCNRTPRHGPAHLKDARLKRQIHNFMTIYKYKRKKLTMGAPGRGTCFQVSQTIGSH